MFVGFPIGAGSSEDGLRWDGVLLSRLRLSPVAISPDSGFCFSSLQIDNFLP
jgi:hypothetical protein